MDNNQIYTCNKDTLESKGSIKKVKYLGLASLSVSTVTSFLGYPLLSVLPFSFAVFLYGVGFHKESIQRMLIRSITLNQDLKSVKILHGFESESNDYDISSISPKQTNDLTQKDTESFIIHLLAKDRELLIVLDKDRKVSNIELLDMILKGDSEQIQEKYVLEEKQYFYEEDISAFVEKNDS